MFFFGTLFIRVAFVVGVVQEQHQHHFPFRSDLVLNLFALFYGQSNCVVEKHHHTKRSY